MATSGAALLERFSSVTLDAHIHVRRRGRYLNLGTGTAVLGTAVTKFSTRGTQVLL